jgi:hypothetical protein
MFMIKKDYNLLSGDEKMYHLQYKVNTASTSLACPNILSEGYLGEVTHGN